MKNTLIVLTLILALAIGVNAQEEVKGLTGKGIKLGLNFSDLTGDGLEGEDLGNRMGFAAGGFLTYSFSPQLAVQTEVLYMPKGIEEDISILDIKVGEYWDYLEVPILLKYSIPMEGNIKPSFFAGPAFAFLMSAKIKIGDEELDIKDGCKSMDMGLAIGGGLTYQMTSVALTFDLRYTMSMTKFVDHEEWNKLESTETIHLLQFDEDPDVKHSSFSFLVGVSF